MSAAPLAGTEHQPHARLVLGAALAQGTPSHAYLLHGPRGSGRRTAATALAAELLAAGAADPESARRRALARIHPDLMWVAPSGAHALLVSDIEPVVEGAELTPFEAERRVFVVDAADTMNDPAANRMLKTLEEPPPYVHLILVAESLAGMLETVASRCQLVRFDPLPSAALAERLESEGIEPGRARACARLALGDAHRARALASPDGEALRAEADVLVAAALAGDARPVGPSEPWRPLLERAEGAQKQVEADGVEGARERLEREPAGRDRRALERELDEAAKRDGRRAKRATLDLGLLLAAASFRDLACIAEEAPEAVLASDRVEELGRAAPGRDPARLRAAAERAEDVRLSLELNVTEELALAALDVRLRELVGAQA